ncbi:MAG TPA: hypothetical protein VFP79_11430, partial [Pseudolabrys sp.]|nr:hypothetical protein [Pseudolabrys sp.]
MKGVPAERAVRVASAPAPVPPAPIPTPDTAGVTQAFARASESLPPPPAARPSFESMFTDRKWPPPAPRAVPGALARAYLYSDLSPDDLAAAEGAMIMLLDDPSPLVRRALS